MTGSRSSPGQRPTVPSRNRNEARVLVALPVFNECRSVAQVLRAVRRHAGDILVVDDGSTDGTEQILQSQDDVRVLRHSDNVGYGQSLIDAFDYAGRRGFEWVLTIDCDHQHEPAWIGRFRRQIAAGRADIVSGSRYLRVMDRGSAPPPPERVAINRAISRLLNTHAALHLTDAFCGFKAYRTEAVAALDLDEPGYGLPLQIWVQAGRAGLNIEEIPVPLIYHDGRRSFAGALEDPQTRVRYYVSVIERELGYPVRCEVEELLCSSADEYRPG